VSCSPTNKGGATSVLISRLGFSWEDGFPLFLSGRLYRLQTSVCNLGRNGLWSHGVILGPVWVCLFLWLKHPLVKYLILMWSELSTFALIACSHPVLFKKSFHQALWLTPVILATQEAEIRRCLVRSQRPYLKNTWLQKRAGRVAPVIQQGQSSEFKPKKKKKKSFPSESPQSLLPGLKAITLLP
jgi:hypothetical protein